MSAFMAIDEVIANYLDQWVLLDELASEGIAYHVVR
jgi:hypothetical protein